ncbi:ATPase [Pseudidiomarina sp. CB1]|uniref:ATPase n=1 Tax=Pseudidiomarina sp. CB1 TaxID=2972484 RepID=UPI0021636CDA|nr:ATPase [Pseudidiomarina sp. CB1]
MQVETIRDVLHWTIAFHENLRDCLQHCAQLNKDERAKLILRYIAEHEDSLARIVKGFANTAEAKALNTWCYDYIDKHPIIHHGHCESPFQALDMPHIMEKTVDHHTHVIELFEHLHTRVDIDSAKELLQTIQNVEENEIKRMVQTANRFSDL